MENIKFKIKDLFSSSTKTISTEEPLNVPVSSTKQREGETYKHWGLRVCAIADGNIHTLVPSLHSCYQSLYRQQSSDKDKQDEYRQQCNEEIAQIKHNIEDLEEQLHVNEETQEAKERQIDEERKKKDEIKSKAYEVNKDEKIKLIIGLFIIIPLTFYLFLFYSSTFYSAFFKDFGADTSIMNAMFDAHALENALETSFVELCFVLSAPVIFMALGFALHFFNEQKGKIKYLKIVAILCVTFTFDAILAYLIGKNLHTMEVTIGTASLDSTYGLSDALSDINTWAVIFCGFIVYIIWGIVFDMSMSAYKQLDLNRVETKRIERTIAELKLRIEELKTAANDLNNNIRKLKGKIQQIELQKEREVLINYALIREAMMDFFTGWMEQMNVLECDLSKQVKAREEFNNILSTLTSTNK